MNFEFTPKGWEDFIYWMENDPQICKKIDDVLKSIARTPFKGIGKPEPLKNELRGYWSRRITGDHRLVYKVSGKRGEDQKCSVIQCRFHYDDK